MADGLAILLSSVSHAGLGGPLDDASGFIFYREIHGFLSDALRNYGVNLFERFVSWTGGVVLILLTLWIFIQGYRIMTGRSRESMTVFATEMMKAVLIVSIATGASLGAGNLHEWISYDLGNLINRLGTGKNTDLFESVDRSLGYMQLAFGVIDGIQVGENRELQSLKDMNMVMVFVGSGIPAIVTGALLLLYEIMAALTLGFSPLFVLCLLFPQTRQLFWGWLYYLLGMLFSLAVLSVMAALAMDMICAVAAAFWVDKFTGANPEGVNSLALQQGGLGLLLTALIVTAPRMAAQFFKGMLADFTPFSAFGSGAARHTGNSQPPTYAPTYTGGNEHAPTSAQMHALRIATPTRMAAQEDQIKPADDTRSFLERYPNATASLGATGGRGDSLPVAAQLGMAGTSSYRESDIQFVVTERTRTPSGGYLEKPRFLEPGSVEYEAAKLKLGAANLREIADAANALGRRLNERGRPEEIETFNSIKSIAVEVNPALAHRASYSAKAHGDAIFINPEIFSDYAPLKQANRMAHEFRHLMKANQGLVGTGYAAKSSPAEDDAEEFAKELFGKDSK